MCPAAQVAISSMPFPICRQIGSVEYAGQLPLFTGSVHGVEPVEIVGEIPRRVRPEIAALRDRSQEGVRKAAWLARAGFDEEYLGIAVRSRRAPFRPR